jgi:secondary thiamine-phosphate synthase enzyme
VSEDIPLSDRESAEGFTIGAVSAVPACLGCPVGVSVAFACTGSLIGHAVLGSSMTRFEISTDDRLTVVDITDRVEAALPADASGTATVFVRHTTAGVTVNEAEARLLGDFESALDGLVPDTGWEHDALDGNADAHLRAMLLGPDVTVPVENGSLALGTWQSVLFVECDGPRTRTVQILPPS